MRNSLKLLLWLFIISGSLTAQEMKPTEIKPIDFTEAAQAFAKKQALEKKTNRTPEEEEDYYSLLDVYPDEASIFQTIGIGCSWYCGEGPYSVTASSSLTSSSKYSYDARNAHDFSHETAWVEGAKGTGIGEYLEYRFIPTAPRITSIIISNGYVKSEKAWRANGRVKRLKVYENGVHLMDFLLPNQRAECHFTLPPLGRREDGEEMVLRFEIAEVYPGEKYEDTVISELYFDGIDVH